MTESSVAPASRRPYDLPMEDRVARLEDDMQEVKSVLSRLEPMIVRIDATLTATLPNLATKAELADLRADVTREISGLRNDNISLRAEMTTEIGSLRADMTTEITSLRSEMTTEIGSLRSEMTKEIATLRTEMIARFADVPTKTYLWGILGVLITACGSGLAALAILK
jgi:phosphoglycerate-specific signal transduction histidine kinase